jgi:hypothetical protein
MKDQCDYRPVCCDKPMFNMGMWPKQGHLGINEPQENGSVNIGVGEEHYVFCHSFHCRECGRYIGLAWHQAPNKEYAVKMKLVMGR